MNEMMRDEILSLSGAKPAWSRRDFVASGLASGFALAAGPVCAQTMIVTDTKGITAGEVRIPAKDVPIPAYAAMPEKGRGFPAVLVVQEIFGVHEHIKDVCRRLAKLGYLAVAPELYHRQGNPAYLTDNKQIFAEIVNKVSDAQVMADLDATIAWARRLDMAHATRLAITGFCWGGRITWMYAAHNPKVKAGVAWYGRVVSPGTAMTPKHPIDVAAQINVPVLGLYGGADAGIPNDTVEKMQAALKAANKPSMIHLYPDTPHAFHADYRPTYRKAQAEDGWKRMQEWFKKHL
jgi:carboxymethylenebutenolidase